ncbi:predicted protein [Arabidopsis lyrata subsp. lyrata]|uniref:Predicted protein n=1 Tax=Arabidopsis lyrata subsp. lyrata TaxID=81972 RepID=D7LNI0_ARALL|nr:predicted protein [Arabidopsis lyrata subsp. lyrata]
MDDIQESFRSFVDKTLALQGGAPINKFSLKCGDRHDEVHVDHWINNALEHGVSELHLRLTDVMRCHFPSNVFVSKTMAKLTLGTEISIVRVPSVTSLPAVLKTLFLDSVWFDKREFSDVFLAGCPALEDLTIDQKSFPGLPNVVSSKTIRRLTIVYTCAHDVDWFRAVALDTPSLVSLFYSTYARHRYRRHCNLDSLIKATLDLHFLENVKCGEPFGPNVTNLIYGIRNVKILHLTSSAAECQGSDNEMKHISHFLLKRECLQLVHVNFSETIVDSKKVQLTEDLFKLPSASS